MEHKITTFINNNDLNGLANYLLFDTHLVVNGNNYRMAEIEMYVCNDHHKDIFTHCHKQQKQMLTWYFHQMSNKDHSYKGGTFKGLDITCGFNNGYAGVLIRSVMNETTNQITEGPCKVVNEFLEKIGCDSIKTLVIDKLNNDISCIKHNLLKLEEKHYVSTDDTKVYVASRIGLSMKGDNLDEKQKWVNNHYRYVIYKTLVKKERKKMIEMICNDV